MRRIPHLVSLLAGLALLAGSAQAQMQIILNSSSVIGGSNPYGASTFDSGSFPATLLVDEQTGTISPENIGSYWLGSSSTGYVVFDLGAAYSLTQIDLFNTHNDGAHDRGTDAFHISASNSASFVNSSQGYILDSAVTILSGTLAFPTDPIPATSFTSANGLAGGTYRYISFTFDSYVSSGGGLHEIRVFAIPEPTTYAAIAGAAMIVVTSWIRRRRKT